MKFTLTVKRKTGTGVNDFTESEPCKNVSLDGSFEADNIGFARRDCNTYIREWAEGSGMRLRTQKDWVKNPRTKALEKQVMMQNGTSPETYVFTLTD